MTQEPQNTGNTISDLISLVDNQFVIPSPYVVWCHLCPNGGKGFLTLEAGRQHSADIHGVRRL